MKTLLKFLLLSLPLSAQAASGGLVAAFATLDSVDSKDVAELEDDGSGFAATLDYVGDNRVGFYGEYVTTRLEDSRTDFALLRTGASYNYAVLPELVVSARAEVAHVNAVGSDFGYGAHGQVSFAVPYVGTIFGRGGYVKAGDLTGPEFSAGVAVPLGKFRALVEYRMNTFESDTFNAEADISSIRLGLGLAF